MPYVIATIPKPHIGYDVHIGNGVRHRITGEIFNKIETIDGQEIITMVWNGGDTICLSRRLLNELTDPDNFFTNGRFKFGTPCRRIRNYIRIGPFELRIIHLAIDLDAYILKRVK